MIELLVACFVCSAICLNVTLHQEQNKDAYWTGSKPFLEGIVGSAVLTLLLWCIIHGFNTIAALLIEYFSKG